MYDPDTRQPGSNRSIPGAGGTYPSNTAPQQQPNAIPAQQRISYAIETRQKSPVLATILSLMPGLGQIFVGYYEQGFINVIIVASLIALLAADIEGLAPFCGFFLAFFWLFNLVDAYRKAVFYNQALAGSGPLELPQESGIARSRGSLVGGTAMIAIGLLFLAHTRFGYSLAWLEDWWPAALVLVGLYLIYKAISERMKERRNSGPAS